VTALPRPCPSRALKRALYKRADAGELVLPGDPPQTVTPQDLQSVALGYMYDPASWFDLAQLLADLDAAAPAAARSLRKFGEPTEFPLYSVMCQDYDFDVPSYATLARFERALARRAPVTPPGSVPSHGGSRPVARTGRPR
jgi:hypothetical protein